MSEGLLFEPLDIAIRVAAAIESNGGNYFVGGSLASSLQGEPRATNDIDLVIELPLGKVRNFRSSLGADFELDEDRLRDALLHDSSEVALVPRRGMCLGPPMAGRGVGSSNQCNAVR